MIAVYAKVDLEWHKRSINEATYALVTYARALSVGTLSTTPISEPVTGTMYCIFTFQQAAKTATQL